jgi:hypothetical protein
VFASNADSTLTVIHQDGPDQYHFTQTITTRRSRATVTEPDKPPCLRGSDDIRAGTGLWSRPRTAAN